jgi:hypothetical protein
MKRKSLLFVMASVCLFSCQQQEELQDPSKGVIDFSTSIDQSINKALTRNSSSLTLPLKNNFAAGDVISMSVAEQDYHPFAIGMDSQTWNEAGTDSETVTFYAHYPELTDEAATTRSLSSRYREIKGGLEYLFGTAQANKGSKNVALAFKRMTTPVVLLDENNQPYEGRAIVKLFLKNKGVQDLFSGKIEADPNAKPEYIDIRKVSEGILTNLIPQIIKAGEKIGTVILEDGKEEPIIAEEDITIEAGTPVAVKMYARRGIIDERTPLFR